MYVVIEQGSIISDWVWVTKGCLQFNKHCVIALVIMTKLISDQLPSLLTREEGGFIQGHSGESMRGTPGEQVKAMPLSVSVSCHSACGWWRLGREALATVLCPRCSAFGARRAPLPALGFCNHPEGGLSGGVSVNYRVFWWVKKVWTKSDRVKTPGSLVIAASGSGYCSTS